ncbi:hypothetical protein BFP72_02945 [Reichenbachiella sp. 5M10]|uniref:redoxin domain-containing protein n=1 Tax=Reichenbachiella sp. 5M10 TaxID=1889772 RepID=UPI000C14F24A|nr:redoxin domain-containing protein [Reichenbachiella sp. 5M10]PIB34447.1 hypothetical protein BFP72_02945 [Reichenbachiella sp. 5M10]
MKKLLFFLSISLIAPALQGQDIDMNFLKLWDVEKEDIVTLPLQQSVSVLIFTSSSCPYDQLYDERIRALHTQYKDRVDFILINAYTPRQGKELASKTKAQAKQFDMPYFIDLNQDAANLFQIEKSPEVAILAKPQGKYTLEYHGAIDDSPQSASNSKHHYVEDVLNNLLQNKPSPHRFVRPAGCRIR